MSDDKILRRDFSRRAAPVSGPEFEECRRFVESVVIERGRLDGSTPLRIERRVQAIMEFILAATRFKPAPTELVFDANTPDEETNRSVEYLKLFQLNLANESFNYFLNCFFDALPEIIRAK